MSKKISIELDESAVRDYAGVKAGAGYSPGFNSLVLACKKALRPKPLPEDLRGCVESYAQRDTWSVESRLSPSSWAEIKALIDYAEAKLKEEG